MGTAYADDAEDAVALRRLLHDRGLVPTEHIVFGVDLWLTNDSGDKPKYKAPYVEVFVLDTAGFTDAKSAITHALESGDLHLGQCFVELTLEEVLLFFRRCRISLVSSDASTKHTGHTHDIWRPIYHATTAAFNRRRGSRRLAPRLQRAVAHAAVYEGVNRSDFAARLRL